MMAVTAFAGPLNPSKASLKTTTTTKTCLSVFMKAVIIFFFKTHIVFHCRQMIFAGSGRRHPETGQNFTTTYLSLILTEGRRE